MGFRVYGVYSWLRIQQFSVTVDESKGSAFPAHAVSRSASSTSLASRDEKLCTGRQLKQVRHDCGTMRQHSKRSSVFQGVHQQLMILRDLDLRKAQQNWECALIGANTRRLYIRRHPCMVG